MIKMYHYWKQMVRHSHKISKAKWKGLRPMIIERLKKRAKYYPIPAMVPVAYEVLKARKVLIHGVSHLLRFVPVQACRHCSEIFVGHTGHCIQTCRGPKWGSKALMHDWVEGNISDVIVPIETFHLDEMFQDVIRHNSRFDFDRIPAVVELCIQAGVECPDYYTSHTEHSYTMQHKAFPNSSWITDDVCEDSKYLDSQHFPPTSDPHTLAERTLQAWETLRAGIKKLLFSYPVKSCKYCQEVHVGPSGHMARLCGIYKHEKWRGHHMWKRAELDDILPPRYVWHLHGQDPTSLRDEGKGFYGKAPAVVEICVQAGAEIPRKYYRGMKINDHMGKLQIDDSRR